MELSFIWQSGGFGLQCKGCGSKDAENSIQDSELPNLSGVFCDTCSKVITGKAVAYYQQKLKEATKNLKSTVLFRQGGTWSAEEVTKLTCSISPERGVWQRVSEFPEYLVIEGHSSDRSISRALKGAAAYTVARVVGNDSKDLPFLPV